MKTQKLQGLFTFWGLIMTFSLLPILSWSANGPYDVSLIPDELKENAHAVIRHDSRKLEVLREGLAVMKVHRAITVLDKEGLKIAHLYLRYDKFDRITSIEGTTYDENGKSLSKLKKKDISDISLGFSSFATDNRAKVVKAVAPNNQYPFTVAYEYTYSYRGLFSFPKWVPQFSERLSVQKAELTIITPDDIGVNYLSNNIAEEVSIQSSGGITTHKWLLENYRVFELEPLSPPFLQQVPVVYLAPKSFNIENYSGRADNWETLGKFFYQLNQGRQEIPLELKQKIDELTAGIDDPIRKAEVLYQYMQNQTRYVSIQLGLGGWQTYDADYVFRNGYGDCKALTNYMRSMLAYLDIPSYSALVYAGEREPDIRTDFPSNQFNHVILCIPQSSDTTWLECTSSTNPFGYLGDFTENRHVLMLTANGGKLIKTPGSTAPMNQQVRQTEIELDPKGNAKVKVHTESSGFQQDRLRYYAEEASSREQEKYLRRRIDAGSFTLEEYSFEEKTPTDVPTYMLDYRLQANNWAKASGPRLFIMPNVLERVEGVPEEMEERTQPVVLRYDYVDIDTVLYGLPAGYTIESLTDEGVEFETVFGSYQAQVKMIDPQTLRYTRRLQMEAIQLPPSYYQELRNFFQQINKADKMQVVLSNRS